jgi:hypothetical protein
LLEGTFIGPPREGHGFAIEKQFTVRWFAWAPESARLHFAEVCDPHGVEINLAHVLAHLRSDSLPGGWVGEWLETG